MVFVTGSGFPDSFTLEMAQRIRTLWTKSKLLLADVGTEGFWIYDPSCFCRPVIDASSEEANHLEPDWSVESQRQGNDDSASRNAAGDQKDLVEVRFRVFATPFRIKKGRMTMAEM